MAPIPLSLADRKAALDSIFDVINETANSNNSQLVRININDSINDIHKKVNKAIEDPTVGGSIMFFNEDYSIGSGALETQINYKITMKVQEYLIRPFKPSFSTSMTSFEGDYVGGTTGVDFTIPINALVTDVMLTSTTRGTHFNLPAFDVKKIATGVLYATADEAKFTSVSFNPADYDQMSGMAGEPKAATITFTVYPDSGAYAKEITIGRN